MSPSGKRARVEGEPGPCARFYFGMTMSGVTCPRPASLSMEGFSTSTAAGISESATSSWSNASVYGFLAAAAAAYG